jgi:imidazolonepropionase-like amidohydrolase
VAPALKQFWDAQVRGFSSNVSVNAKIFEWRAADVKALYDANVPLLAGTDLGFAYVYPGDVGQELELLVRVGLPALDALRTATINPARYLNKEKDLGSVEIGKIADLVLLDGNPLSDIHNVKLVRAVVLNGRFLDHTQLEAMLPTF